MKPRRRQRPAAGRCTRCLFCLGSVAIFASEIALLLLPLYRGGDGKLDSALFIHHVGVFSMMLTGYVIADGNAHALRGGATILALAAPSYTCVPKALRARHQIVQVE